MKHTIIIYLSLKVQMQSYLYLFFFLIYHRQKLSKQTGVNTDKK